MNKLAYQLTIFLIFISISLSAQSSNPKREFRGVWIASVINLDWPTSPGLSANTQKQQLIDLLDDLKELGFNAVVFQVRPECDALYNSSYEPWSYWLTGTQGKAPEPYYDPLEFAVEEAHKRGMELHAWFNPFRAVREVGNYQVSADHVSEKHPDWILTFDNLKILDPGLQEVRDYNTEVIMDVVRRYDIDGVHFDDYFYPYPPNQITDEDENTFLNNWRGFFNVGDWRRDNINIFIKQVHDAIAAEKPWVKFGISPFGIWRPGYPSGITGTDAYSVLYADATAWLQQQTVDYLTPQLYWPFGGGQDYGKLMPWWADSVAAHNRHFYPGQAAYRIPNWTNSNEMGNQIRANRTNPNTLGSVFFRAKVGVLDNPKGFADSLQSNFYKNPALPPNMNWKDQVIPNPPQNFRYDKLTDIRGDGLMWSTPQTAADGDSAFMYAVYKFDNASVQQADLDNSQNLRELTGESSLKLNPSDVSNGTSYFTVTALDRNFNESQLSSVIPVQVDIPAQPNLFLPADLAINQKDTIQFKWDNSAHSNFNRIQISSNNEFTDLLVNSNSIVDTFKLVSGFEGLTKYYWRVSASNIAGESEYSDVRTFTTGFPKAPVKLQPADKITDVNLMPELAWNSSKAAVNYRLQIAEGSYFLPKYLIVDTVVTDTTFLMSSLKKNTFYTWSVGAENEYGYSGMPTIFRFKTGSVTGINNAENGIPIEYSLSQNYPNPFNPTTKIMFSLPENGHVVLRVYNVLGQQIRELVNEKLNPGTYEVEFNAEGLTSGMYIYVLNTGERNLVNKMILLK